MKIVPARYVWKTTKWLTYKDIMLFDRFCKELLNWIAGSWQAYAQTTDAQYLVCNVLLNDWPWKWPDAKCLGFDDLYDG